MNSGQLGQVESIPDLQPGICEASRGKTLMQQLKGQGTLSYMLALTEKLSASGKMTGKKVFVVFFGVQHRQIHTGEEESAGGSGQQDLMWGWVYNLLSAVKLGPRATRTYFL